MTEASLRRNRGLHIVRMFGAEAARPWLEAAGVPASVQRALRRLDGEVVPGAAHRAFSIISLPRHEPDDPFVPWTRRYALPGVEVMLSLEPGTLLIDGQPRRLGVPCGSTARLILLQLWSEALRRDDPVVPLGPSWSAWVRAIGLDGGGRSARLAQEQLLRILACTLRCTWETADAREGAIGLRKEPMIEAATLRSGGRSLIGCSQSDQVVFSASFFEELRAHAVWINLAAVRAIRETPRAMDLYLWLAFRARLGHDKAQRIRWPRLHAQFGHEYHRLRQFKPAFLRALRLALEAFGPAHATISDDGIVLSWDALAWRSQAQAHPLRPPRPRGRLGLRP